MIIYCLSSSPRRLNIFEVWLTPEIMVTGNTNILDFVNIQRNQSGLYRCILTSAVTNQTESTDLQVTVHCEYDFVEYVWLCHGLLTC